MATSVQVVFDCADPAKLARFWAAALQYIEPPPPTGFATWEDFLQAQGIPESDWNRASAIEDPDHIGPRLYFQRVPEAKIVKNRVHLDLHSSGGRAVPIAERRERVRAEVERLKVLGATYLYEMEELGTYWITMQDPEGNEFCVH